MFSNRITKLFNINYPIIQAGMVWASGWKLASAVSNAGALGIIGSGSMYPDVLRTHIQKCKAATSKAFAVNVPLLYPGIEKHIDINTKVRTDMWRGYLPLKETYPLLEQELSWSGTNFEEIHLVIMNLKGWLRGIHHHCSSDQLQGYLDEFFYRFNRRTFPKTMLHKLLARMVNHKPLFLYTKEN